MRLGFALLATALSVVNAGQSTAAPPVARTATAVDPTGALQALADFLNAPTFEGLAISAEGSPAYVYLDGLKLIDENRAPQRFLDDLEVEVAGGAVTDTAGRFALDSLVFDDQGLIVDLDRQGRPVSETVFPLYQVVEGVDAGAGVTGTIHSLRYFDGNLHFVTLTENHSTTAASVSVDQFVSGRQQFANLYTDEVPPSVASANVDAFEGVPERGGTGLGHIWADGIAVVEFEVAVPPAGGAEPATTSAT